MTRRSRPRRDPAARSTPYPNAKLQDNAQFKADQKKQVNQVLVLVYVLLFFAVIIAFIGIVNTLALSIYERTREIGLLRAGRDVARQVRSMIRWESVIIALFGTLLGLAIGCSSAGRSCARCTTRASRSSRSRPVSSSSSCRHHGLASVVAGRVFPARRAAKLDVLKAISTE